MLILFIIKGVIAVTPFYFTMENFLVIDPILYQNDPV